MKAVPTTLLTRISILESKSLVSRAIIKTFSPSMQRMVVKNPPKNQTCASRLYPNAPVVPTAPIQKMIMRGLNPFRTTPFNQNFKRDSSSNLLSLIDRLTIQEEIPKLMRTTAPIIPNQNFTSSFSIKEEKPTITAAMRMTSVIMMPKDTAIARAKPYPKAV